MKELSIEEKAKRYDELLTSAKNTIEVNQTIPNIVDCVKSLFPELTENKEEKIKKIISDILLIDSDEIREILDTNNVLMQDIDAWLEKQDEYKSNVNCLLSWSEEDDKNLSIAIQYVFQRGYLSTVNWLKSLKERYTWKPSEKQISALEWQVKNTYEGSWQYIETKKLLEQLKRLM